MVRKLASVLKGSNSTCALIWGGGGGLGVASYKWVCTAEGNVECPSSVLVLGAKPNAAY